MTENPCAVIVGVGPGLGAALVRAFAADGLTVVAAARRATQFETLAEGTDADRIHAHDCDATNPEDVADLFARATRDHGPLRAAVFNAGAFERGSILDIDPADFERCWRVGTFAGFLVGQAAARAMVPEGQGTIIFTGATASLRGGAGFVNLASPKFALRALAQSMARELGPKGVHVAHVIIDGQIRSPRYEAMAADRGPDALLEPDRIADTYLAIHHQHRSAWAHEVDLRPWSERF